MPSSTASLDLVVFLPVILLWFFYIVNEETKKIHYYYIAPIFTYSFIPSIKLTKDKGENNTQREHKRFDEKKTGSSCLFTSNTVVIFLLC